MSLHKKTEKQSILLIKSHCLLDKNLSRHRICGEGEGKEKKKTQRGPQ